MGSALTILTGLITILSSPGGLSALNRLFDEGGITPEKVEATIAALPKPVPLPGDGVPK